jgi:hypothetical protein
MKLHDKPVLSSISPYIFDAQSEYKYPGWEAGAADNIFLHHSVLECPKAIIDKLVREMEQLAEGDLSHEQNIRDSFRRWHTIHLIDPLISRLLRNSGKLSLKPYLNDFVHRLAFASEEPEEVKAGIALLGIIGCNGDDIRKLKYMAVCEEYTAFVVMTLNSLLVEADPHIWELAQITEGWGRINCIEQLRHTSDVRIKHWLLYEGYNNVIGNEYTALICAQTGNLALALSAENINAQLLNSACDIINALLIDESTGGIDDYVDAYEACRHYVYHAGLYMSGVKHYALLIRLAKYIKNPLANQTKRELCGWSVQRTNRLYADIKKLLGDCRFKRQVLAVIDSDESEDLLLAANYLGFDRWEANWKKLHSNPLNPAYWREIFRLLNDERAEIVAEYIKESECWVEFATESETGSYCHLALDEILKGIVAYPGMGAKLLPYTLVSAVQRHRTATKKVLEAWGWSEANLS